jgi:hypothetical protein
MRHTSSLSKLRDNTLVSNSSKVFSPRSDHVHFVDEATLHAIHRHLGAAKFLEDAVAQRGGARSAAGHGENHQQVVGLPGARHLADAVAGLTGLLQPRRGRPMGAAGEDTQGRHKSGTRKRETGMDVHVDPSACRTR